MYEHIDKIESMVDVPIVRLKPDIPFEYWMYTHRIKSDKGLVGCGWPQSFSRWCTRAKVRTIRRYINNIPNALSAVGIAADEKNRAKERDGVVYPLVDWGISEQQALSYCFEKGFDFGGLYKHFRRVSCFCCPLQKLSALKTLRREFPELWTRMLYMDSVIPVRSRGFKGYKTVYDIDRRFAQEERQLELWAA